MRAVTLNALFVLGFSTGVPRAEEIAIPKPAAEVLENYCIDCHDKGLKKGGLNLDVASIDWSQPESRELWGRVHRYSHDQLMPPPKKDQPTAKEREVVWAWLDESLMKHSPIGGTPPRRLNQQEYQNTIRQLFHLPDFELPAGFPDDPEYHGFNNVGHGLVTSPPLIWAIGMRRRNAGATTARISLLSPRTIMTSGFVSRIARTASCDVVPKASTVATMPPSP